MWALTVVTLVPWKSIYLAAGLLLVGSILVILGALIKVGIITSEVRCLSHVYTTLQKYIHDLVLLPLDMA